MEPAEEFDVFYERLALGMELGAVSEVLSVEVVKEEASAQARLKTPEQSKRRRAAKAKRV
jgi:hypothetical protein